MTHCIPKTQTNRVTCKRHCNTVVIALSPSLLLDLWLGSFHWWRVFYTSTASGWDITSVDLSLSPVAQSCQLFKREKQAFCGTGKQFYAKASHLHPLFPPECPVHLGLKNLLLVLLFIWVYIQLTREISKTNRKFPRNRQGEWKSEKRSLSATAFICMFRSRLAFFFLRRKGAPCWNEGLVEWISKNERKIERAFARRGIRLCQGANGTNRFLCRICSHYWLIGRLTGT